MRRGGGGGGDKDNTIMHSNNSNGTIFSNWKRKEKRKLVLIGLQIKR